MGRRLRTENRGIHRADFYCGRKAVPDWNEPSKKQEGAHGRQLKEMNVMSTGRYFVVALKIFIQ